MTHELRIVDTSTNELAQAVDMYLQAVNATASSPRTASTYADVLRQFLAFAPVDTLQAVTPDLVNRYLNHLKARPVSLYTVRKHFVTLQGFWTWALRQGLTETDIFRRLEKPKVPQQVKPALTLEQIQRVLQACEGKHWLRLRDRALILLLLDTGARAQEVHRLTVLDVSHDPIILKGKHAKERVAFLSAETRLALLRYLKACPFHPTGEQPLWWGAKGALTLWGVLEVVEHIGNRAGIRPLGCHIFRRSFATWSLRNGIDLHRLQLLLGHSCMTVTAQYLALVEDDLKRAHEQFSPLRMLKTQHTRGGK
jgi:site-specific recombinase XerD